jgi:hypothetical protein
MIIIWKVDVFGRDVLRQPDPVAAQKELVAVFLHLLGSNPEDHRATMPASHCSSGYRIQGKMNVVPLAFAQAIDADGRHIPGCGAGVKEIRWFGCFQI